jgi:hypothetical protein
MNSSNDSVVTTPNEGTSFTLSEYARLIGLTAASYPCVGFEVLDCAPPSERFAIIRHDIDMSPVNALALARIEAKLGVRATYTILLSGEFYNPFERSTRELLQQIGNLGHDLGLHFDAAWHGIENESELTEAISLEAGVLNRLLELPVARQINMFSFHNTTPFTMDCKASHYAGLRNAYAGYLQQHVQYTSDSNGYWIHRSWQDLLDQRPGCIQVLTHPEWWTTTDSSPAEKVCRQLTSRSLSTWVGYRTLLQQGNRENRTGLSAAPSALANLFPEDGDRLMVLWFEGCRSEAFVELFCRLEKLCRRILMKYFRVNLKTTASTVRALLTDHRLQLDPLLALSVISNTPVAKLLGISIQTYQKVKQQRNALVHGYGGVSPVELTVSFDRLIKAVGRLAYQEPVLVDATGNRRVTTQGMLRNSDEQAVLRWLEANHKRLELSTSAIHSFGQRHRLMIAKGGEA